MRLLTATLASLLALVAACDAQETADSGPITRETADITDTTVSTTITTTTTTSPTSSTSATTAPEAIAGEPSARCDSPEGYSIGYPEAWATNSGDVVPECGQFHPEPFDVAPGTDERVAAVTVFIDPVPFARVAALDQAEDGERAATVVDGLQAVRLEYQVREDALWPAGTPITLYAVDVSTESEERTLIADTVGLSQFDYERNKVVLDRMARTLEIDMDGVSGDPGVVADYRGGGGGFSVEGTVSGSEACLRIPPEGEEICTELPASDQLHTVQLEDLEPVLAGVTGEEVFSVAAERRDGTTSTVLPAPIGEREDVGGFSFTFGLDEIERFVLRDVEGAELRTIEPGG